MDYVWHLFEELFGLIQQLENISGMESLCGKKAVSTPNLNQQTIRCLRDKVKGSYLVPADP